jgi:hypothetical protein
VNGISCLPADRGKSIVRLLYLLLLGLTACFASSMVIYLVVERILFELFPVPPVLNVTILLFVVVWHTRMLWRRLPPALMEPVRRAAEGRIELPLDRRWLAVFQMVGLSFGAVAALDLWRIFSAGMQRDLLFPHGIEFLSLLVVKVILALLLAWSAIRASRGQWLPRALGAQLKKADWPDGKLPQMVRTCLYAAILATAGMLCANALFQHLPWQSILGVSNKTLPAAFGAQLGAIVAVHLLKVPAPVRRVLTAGLLAEGAGRLVGGNGASVLLVLGAVFAMEWFGQYKAGRPAGSARWNAARAAWAFCLGALVGRMAGRVVGGLLFGLFGVAGPVTGEALGLVFMALAGYMYARSPEELIPTPDVDAFRS